MDRHTPGPWEYTEEHSECMGEAVVQRQICYRSDYGLVQLNLNGVGDKYPHSEANAKLIAAAPELLEACRKAGKAIDGILTWGEPGPLRATVRQELTDVINALELAVVKAAQDG